MVFSFVLAATLAASQVAFPPLVARDLVGHGVSELPPATEIGIFSMPVPAHPSLVVQFRRVGSHSVLLLLEGDGVSACIIDAVALPRLGRFETVVFGCVRKGSEAAEGEMLVGVGDERKGEFVARRAWRLVFEPAKFEPLSDSVVLCRPESYAN